MGRPKKADVDTETKPKTRKPRQKKPDLTEVLLAKIAELEKKIDNQKASVSEDMQPVVRREVVTTTKGPVTREKKSGTQKARIVPLNLGPRPNTFVDDGKEDAHLRKDSQSQNFHKSRRTPKEKKTYLCDYCNAPIEMYESALPPSDVLLACNNCSTTRRS